MVTCEDFKYTQNRMGGEGENNRILEYQTVL